MVWLNFPTAYSFVMISPNLYAIGVFLLMNLSQDLKLVLLRYFGTLGDGYSLKGNNKKPSRHSWYAEYGCDHGVQYLLCEAVPLNCSVSVLIMLVFKTFSVRLSL